MSTLRITEIFYSLQGETRTVGLPTVFIRLTGCPLRCGYCDTAYAFKGGEVLSIDAIMNKVKSYNAKYVTVTGGEPLAQKAVHGLMSQLCDNGHTVSIETSGALDISHIDPRVDIVMDIKTPASGEVERNLYENITYLKADDQVKFVICDQSDYAFAKQIIEQYNLQDKCQLLMSPSHEVLSNECLADWIIADNLPVRFQLQLHKYIWGDKPGV